MEATRRQQRRGCAVANEANQAGPGAAQATPGVKYAWPEKPTLLGTPVKRLDGPDKVTGRARYTYDINRPGHDLRPDGPLAASAREHRVDRSVRGGEGAGRQGCPGLERGGRRTDVSGRSRRGGRGRHRRARARRGAPDPRALRVAAARGDRSAGDGRRRAAVVHRAATRARARGRKPAISTPASSRPRTSSKRPTRRT